MSEKPGHVPKMKEDTDYLQFKKEVMLWASITTMAEKSRAGNLVFQLPDKAKAVCLNMSTEELADGVTRRGTENQELKVTGIQRLLEVLDGVYLDDLHKEKFKAYNAFRNCKRSKEQPVSDFLIFYELKKKHLEDHDIKLPEEIYAFELLASSNLSPQQESLANTTVPVLTYESMKGQIKKVVSNASSENSSLIKVVKEEVTGFYNSEAVAQGQGASGRSDNVEEKEHLYDEFGGDSETYYTGRGRPLYQGQGRYNRSSGNNWRSRNSDSSNWRSNTRGGRGLYRTNPKDQYGNIQTCNVCNSIEHFASYCPENTQYFAQAEHITLFQTMEKQSNPWRKSMYPGFIGDNLAVLDTGCNITVCGKQWLKVYLESLDDEEMRAVFRSESYVRFKFGDNVATVSRQQYVLPATVCNKRVQIKTEVVDENIPLLMSKRSMAKANMIIDFGDNTVTAFGCTERLLINDSGHCSIPLKKMKSYSSHSTRDHAMSKIGNHREKVFNRRENSTHWKGPATKEISDTVPDPLTVHRTESLYAFDNVRQPLQKEELQAEEVKAGKVESSEQYRSLDETSDEDVQDHDVSPKLSWGKKQFVVTVRTEAPFAKARGYLDETLG